MSPLFRAVSCLFAVLLVGAANSAPGLAQTPRPSSPPVSVVPIPEIGNQSSPSPAPPDASLVPLKVQVTISRYQNDKRTSSTPFTMWVNANEGRDTTLNMGLQVPIPTGPVLSSTTAATGGTQSYTYTNVGTNITARAFRMADGRYQLTLDVQDSSVAPAGDGTGRQTGMSPTLTSLRASNRVLLRDGQTAEFVTTTDKISGEVTKIDVLVTVIK